MYTEIFCCKNVSAKATHIFSAKNIRILYIESAKTVNEMTRNKLFFFFFLIWVLQPFQEYFTYIKPIVHRRWAKTGGPGEKPPDHP